MATYSKVQLSGSSQGRQIKVAATATPGTAIHATGVSATILDELTLFASNSDTTARKLTIELGGTTSPDDLLEIEIPAESGMNLIVSGIPLSGTGAATTTTRAFCATANVVMISGFVNRNTP